MTGVARHLWRGTLSKVRRVVNYPFFWVRARHKALLTDEFLWVFRALDYSSQGIEFVEACQRGILHDFDLDENAVVFDVGASQGDFALAVHERYGCTVHAFEPHPFAFADMSARVRATPQITCHAFGLAGHDASAELTDLGIGSSIYSDSPGYVRASKMSVPLKDILDIVAELGLERIDVLKVNIEGGEYELLERVIDSGLVQRCRYVMVQFHRWFPNAERRRAAIREQLRATHDTVWDYPFIWEKWVKR